MIIRFIAHRVQDGYTNTIDDQLKTRRKKGITATYGIVGRSIFVQLKTDRMQWPNLEINRSQKDFRIQWWQPWKYIDPWIYRPALWFDEGRWLWCNWGVRLKIRLSHHTADFPTKQPNWTAEHHRSAATKPRNTDPPPRRAPQSRLQQPWRDSTAPPPPASKSSRPTTLMVLAYQAPFIGPRTVPYRL